MLSVDSNGQSQGASLSANNNSLCKNDDNLWHHRLGHIPFSRLNYIPRIHVKQNTLDTSVCITYLMAKHTHFSIS